MLSPHDGSPTPPITPPTMAPTFVDALLLLVPAQDAMGKSAADRVLGMPLLAQSRSVAWDGSTSSKLRQVNAAAAEAVVVTVCACADCASYHLAAGGKKGRQGARAAATALPVAGSRQGKCCWGRLRRTPCRGLPAWPAAHMPTLLENAECAARPAGSGVLPGSVAGCKSAMGSTDNAAQLNRRRQAEHAGVCASVCATPCLHGEAFWRVPTDGIPRHIAARGAWQHGCLEARREDQGKSRKKSAALQNLQLNHLEFSQF